MSRLDSDFDIFGATSSNGSSETNPPSRSAPRPPSKKKKDLSPMIGDEMMLSSIPTPTSRYVCFHLLYLWINHKTNNAQGENAVRNATKVGGSSDVSKDSN